MLEQQTQINAEQQSVTTTIQDPVTGETVAGNTPIIVEDTSKTGGQQIPSKEKTQQVASGSKPKGVSLSSGVLYEFLGDHNMELGDVDTSSFDPERLALFNKNANVDGYILSDAIHGVKQDEALRRIAFGDDMGMDYLGGPLEKEEISIDIKAAYDQLKNDMSLKTGDRVRYERSLSIIAEANNKGMSLVKSKNGNYWFESREGNIVKYALNNIQGVADVLDNYFDKGTEEDDITIDPESKENDSVLPIVGPDGIVETEEDLQGYTEHEIAYLASIGIDLGTTIAGLTFKATGVGAPIGAAVSLIGGLIAVGTRAWADFDNEDISNEAAWKNIGIGVGLEAVEAFSIAPASMLGYFARGSKSLGIIKKTIRMGMAYMGVKTIVGTNWNHLIDKVQDPNKKLTINDYREMATLVSFLGSASVTMAGRRSSKIGIAKTMKSNKVTGPIAKKLKSTARIESKREALAVANKEVVPAVAARKKVVGENIEAVKKNKGLDTKIKKEKSAVRGDKTKEIYNAERAVDAKYRDKLKGLGPKNRAALKKTIAAEKKTVVASIKQKRTAVIDAIEAKKAAVDSKGLKKADTNVAVAKAKTKKAAEGSKKQQEDLLEADRKQRLKNVHDKVAKAEEKFGKRAAARFERKANNKVNPENKLTRQEQRAIRDGESQVASKKRIDAAKAKVDAVDVKIKKQTALLKTKKEALAKSAKENATTKEKTATKKLEDEITAITKEIDGGEASKIAAKAKVDALVTPSRRQRLTKATENAGRLIGEKTQAGLNSISGTIRRANFLEAGIFDPSIIYGHQYADKKGNNAYKGRYLDMTLEQVKAALEDAGYDPAEFDKYTRRDLTRALQFHNAKIRKEKKKVKMKKHGGLISYDNSKNVAKAQVGVSFPTVSRWIYNIWNYFNDDSAEVTPKVNPEAIIIDESGVEITPEVNDTSIHITPITVNDETKTQPGKSIPDKTPVVVPEVEDLVPISPPTLIPQTPVIQGNTTADKILRRALKYFDPTLLMPAGKIFRTTPGIHRMEASVLQSRPIRNMEGFTQALNAADVIRPLDTADYLLAANNKRKQVNDSLTRRNDMVTRNAQFINAQEDRNMEVANRNIEARTNVENNYLSQLNAIEIKTAEQDAINRGRLWSDRQKKIGQGLTAAVRAGVDIHSDIRNRGVKEKLIQVYNDKAVFDRDVLPLLKAATTNEQIRKIKDEWRQKNKSDPDRFVYDINMYRTMLQE